MGSDTNDNDGRIEVPTSKAIKDLGFTGVFLLTEKKKKYLEIGHQLFNGKGPVQIPYEKKKGAVKELVEITVNLLEVSGIERKTAESFVLLFAKDLLEFEQHRKQNKESGGTGVGVGIGIEEKDRIEYQAFKYSKGIPLAEEITHAPPNSKRRANKFLQIIDGKPVISPEIIIDEIDEEYTVIVPHNASIVSPILPYEFESDADIEDFIKLAKNETIDSIYYKHKSIWKQIVVTPDNNFIKLLATDSVYSYFQDKFSTTHYDMLIGAAGGGKGAALLGFKYLGYRVVLASDMSGASILDLLGSLEANQVTVVEDELNDIYEDKDKLKIYKLGYDDSAVVPRTLDGNTSNRNNRYYYTFGFKVFAAEDSPDNKKLEGFKDRIFSENTLRGEPSVYVKELSKPSGSKKYQKLLDRVNYLRKLTLMFRLVHSNDVIERINTNISGRALELTGPQLRLFNSSKLASPDKKALKEILPMLSNYLKKKGQLAKDTTDSKIYNAVNSLIDSDIGINTTGSLDNAPLYQLTYNSIYKAVGEEVNGEDVLDQQVIYSDDNHKISHNSIIKTCVDKFRATRDNTGTGKNRQRVLIFNKDTMKTVSEIFTVVDEIKLFDKSSEPDDLVDDEEDRQAWWSNDVGHVTDSETNSETDTETSTEKSSVTNSENLGRDLDGIGTEPQKSSNITDDINSDKQENENVDGWTGFLPNKDENATNSKNDNSSNNTDRNVKDLQENNDNNKDISSGTGRDFNKTDSVPIPSKSSPHVYDSQIEKNDSISLSVENPVHQSRTKEGLELKSELGLGLELDLEPETPRMSKIMARALSIKTGHNLYSRRDGFWACSVCKRFGDRWFMQEMHCVSTDTGKNRKSSK